MRSSTFKTATVQRDPVDAFRQEGRAHSDSPRSARQKASWLIVLATSLLIGCGPTTVAEKEAATQEAATQKTAKADLENLISGESDESADQNTTAAASETAAPDVDMPSPPDSASDPESSDQDSLGIGPDDKALPSLLDPIPDSENLNPVDSYVTPDQIAAKAFTEPEGATQLSKKNLWVDMENHRVIADGYIAMRDGPLEMFACGVGTKEHESVLALLPKASELHAGLLAIGAEPGAPVQIDPEFRPPHGEKLRIWVTYFDSEKNFAVADARNWILDGERKKLELDWVFAGSFVWKDPRDGREYYQGNNGDMICVSNFVGSTLDLPIESSASQNFLRFRPNTSEIPIEGTPVRVVIEPIGDETLPSPPEASILKLAPKEDKTS